MGSDDMMRFAFISRHTPTQSQNDLAKAQDIELVHVGDADAFTVGPFHFADGGKWDGVVVVHPAAAMRLAPLYLVGVFENANRAEVGKPPQFEAVGFHVYNLLGRFQAAESST